MFAPLKRGKRWRALFGLVMLVLAQVAIERDALVVVQGFPLERVAPRTQTSSKIQLRAFKHMLFPTRNSTASLASKIPFIIEQLGDRPKKQVRPSTESGIPSSMQYVTQITSQTHLSNSSQVFNEISDMCIDVFFNEDESPAKGT
jgi:hypothetical protein